MGLQRWPSKPCVASLLLPISGATPTHAVALLRTLPAFSGRAARRSAAVPVAPEEMPTKIPFSLAYRWAAAMASSLETCGGGSGWEVLGGGVEGGSHGRRREQGLG